MNDLDDLALVERNDPEDYLGRVESFGDQIRDARERAGALDELPSAEGVNSIAVLGMGGSGISGDVARAILGGPSPIFFQTLKGYDLPGWVGENSLIFAMSYSGNTEETLATFEEARRRGARVVIVSTGGQITEWGREFGLPVVEIPSGLQPRAALGYLSVPILIVCSRMGLTPDLGQQIHEAAALLDQRASEWGRGAPSEKNPTKQLATRLFGKLPIVYGTEGLAEVAAYRWKCQFNEVSKVPAWSNSFPELNHNEVVGWKEVAALTREHLGLVVLRHAGEHRRNAKRVAATLPAIQGNLAFAEEIWGEGTSALATLFDLVCFGDYVATYLALGQGVDPSEVEIIGRIKKQLAG